MKRQPVKITVRLTFTDPVNGPTRAAQALVRMQLSQTDNAHPGERQTTQPGV